MYGYEVLATSCTHFWKTVATQYMQDCVDCARERRESW